MSAPGQRPVFDGGQRPVFDSGQRPVFDAGDAAAVAARDERLARAGARRAAGLRYILDDRRGRDWLWSLLEDCRIWASSYTGDQTTVFNEGTRNVGLRLLSELDAAAPEALVTLIMENRSDDRDDEQPPAQP